MWEVWTQGSERVKWELGNCLYLKRENGPLGVGITNEKMGMGKWEVSAESRLTMRLQIWNEKDWGPGMRYFPLFYELYYTVLTITEHFVVGSLSFFGVEDSKLEVNRSLPEENNNKTSFTRNMRLIVQSHWNATAQCTYLLPLVLPRRVIPMGKKT